MQKCKKWWLFNIYTSHTFIMWTVWFIFTSHNPAGLCTCIEASLHNFTMTAALCYFDFLYFASFFLINCQIPVWSYSFAVLKRACRLSWMGIECIVCVEFLFPRMTGVQCTLLQVSFAHVQCVIFLLLTFSLQCVLHCLFCVVLCRCIVPPMFR